jgi:organic radical activating enzyme
MDMLATATLRVNETFLSVQGEGSEIGAPTFFIRLDGCPLRCSWCDTPYALAGDAGHEAGVEELAQRALTTRRIVFSISPKVGTSGYAPKPVVLRKFCATAAGRMQLKFVIAEDRDYEEALACVEALDGALPVRTPIILQPESGRAGQGEQYMTTLRTLTEKTVGDERWAGFDVRVLPQLHYLLWGGAPGR